MTNYLTASSGSAQVAAEPNVPQTIKVSEAQLLNNAGGFSFQVSPMQQLDRFLFLGTEGGTYYTSERKLTEDNVSTIVELIKTSGLDVAKRVDQVLSEGLVLRNTAALFVWALITKYGDIEARKYVHTNTHRVCRTGTDIMMLQSNFNFLHNSESMGRRKAIGRWYTERSPHQLAYQIAKYGSRSGLNNRDLLRLSHPKLSPEHAPIGHFLAGRMDASDLQAAIGLNHLTGAFWANQADNVDSLLEIIQTYGLTWEMIPTQFLNDAAVWDYLVPNSGYQALLRNLNRLTINGWLQPASDNMVKLTELFTNVEFIEKSRIHPFSIYLAARTYASGQGMRGKQTWTPVTGIAAALDKAFTHAFRNVEPTNKRHFLALDVSGSMNSEAMPGISCMEASAVLALITLRTEPKVQIMAFSDGNRKSDIMHPVDLDSTSSLNQVKKALNDLSSHFTGTDCALPFQLALKNKWEFDAFTLFTDSETWHGYKHPHVSLKEYQKQINPAARSLVVAMTSNHVSVAETGNPSMLDVAGLSADFPRVAAAFFNGEI